MKMKKFKSGKTMRKAMAILLAMVIILGLASCKDSNKTSNKDTNKDTSTKKEASTEVQKKSGSGCTYDFPMTGFGFDLPEGVEISKGFIYEYDMGDVDYKSGVMMAWPVYYDISEEKYENLTIEDVGKYNTAIPFQIFCVKDVDSFEAAIEKMITESEKATGEKMSEEEKAETKKMREIHRENGYMWIAYKTPKGEVSKECQEEYDAFYNAEEEIIKNHMKFYTPEVWEGTEEGSSIHFETTDLEGNPVKSDTVFAKNKVTMVNIWATTCGPCIQEMPELEKLNKEFAKKGGAIIGVVRDVPLGNNMYLQEAKDIIKDTGVTYPNIRTWDDFDSMFSVLGTPTTYFVDSKGNIVGEPVLGANIKKYKEIMEELLPQAK